MSTRNKLVTPATRVAPRKLVLARSTLRSLAELDLQHVAGAAKVPTMTGSRMHTDCL